MRPHLEYAVPVWAATSVKDLDKLEQTQVQCLKRITGAKAKRTSSRPAMRRRDPQSSPTYVQQWAERNNLKLNCSKSTVVIFRDRTRRRHHAATAAEPAPLPGIARSSCLEMLGVSIENDFSIAQHVQRLVWSFTKAPDRNRIDSVLDRARRHGYCPLPQ